MIRLLHLSDVHLGAPFLDFGSYADARRQEVLDAFRGLPQIAETEQAHAVLLAGDLFDSARPSDYTLAVVRQTLRRLVDAGRPVFLIPGNHDALTCNPSLYQEQFGGAMVFRSPSFGPPYSVETEGGSLHVYGLAYDWARPDPLGTFRRIEGQGVHVVLLHGALPRFPQWRWYPNALRIQPAWLAAAPADYVALGGSHLFRSPADLGHASGGRACYSGAFGATTLAEPGVMGYGVVDLEPDAEPRIVLRASRVRMVHDVGTLDVEGLVDERAISSRIAERTPEHTIPTVKLVGQPEFPLDAARVQLELERLFGCARVEDSTWYAGSGRLDEVAEQDTISGHVVRLGRQRLLEAGEDAAAPLGAERALRVALRALRVGD